LSYHFLFRWEEKLRKSSNLFEISGFQNVLYNDIQKLEHVGSEFFLLGILLIKAKRHNVFKADDKLLRIRCCSNFEFHFRVLAGEYVAITMNKLAKVTFDIICTGSYGLALVLALVPQGAPVYFVDMDKSLISND